MRIINGYPKISATGPISVCNGSEARVSEKIRQRKNSMPSNGPAERKRAMTKPHIQNRNDDQNKVQVKRGFSTNPGTNIKARTHFSGLNSTGDSAKM